MFGNGQHQAGGGGVVVGAVGEGGHIGLQTHQRQEHGAQGRERRYGPDPGPLGEDADQVKQGLPGKSGKGDGGELLVGSQPALVFEDDRRPLAIDVTDQDQILAVFSRQAVGRRRRSGSRLWAQSGGAGCPENSAPGGRKSGL